jgi:medium-chain acyl-[acyl-carrier-protein] hydrolase
MRSPSRGLHRLPQRELLHELKHYEGTPPGILDNEKLMAMLLPAIRADFSIVERYVYQAGPALPVPLTALAGKSDHFISAAQVAAWGPETMSTFDIRWFNGGHLFIRDEQQLVMETIRDALLSAAEPALAHSALSVEGA